MSICSLNFFARTLNFRTEVRVALPEYPMQRDASFARRDAWDREIRFPVVYLLHGFTGDYSDWFQMVPIEKYSQEYGFAVIMPHGYNSWYMDLPAGPKVGSYIAEELPAAMEALLPISDVPSDRFIAGLSMGGTGAVYTALKHPGNYRAVASASGVMNRELLKAQHACDNSLDCQEMLNCLNYAFPTGCPDIEDLYADLIRKKIDIPEHMFLYGEQDDMYDSQYCWFSRFAMQHKLPVVMESSPGAHDFAFWDPAVKRMFEWFRVKLEQSRP